jgi:GAF domain-containing protein
MTEKYHKRLKDLFADIERLAEQPDSDTAAVRRELQALRARVIELEIQFLENQKREAEKVEPDPAEEVTPRRTAPPILYDKEQIGYDYTGDKLLPLQISNLSGLDVQRAIYVPLTQTGQSVGAVYVEPPPQQSWSSDETNMAESVAQQVSLQIQNLRLLAAAERARAEAQAATRRFAHESWQEYLDAIQRDERIGYAYDQNAVTPVIDAPHDADIQASVDVLGEQVGSLYLKSSPANPLTEEDRTLIEAVARQVAQQVESLRLLADAARARADAEEATRRLTRTSWQEYAEQRQDETMGFVYDSNRVTPLEAGNCPGT